VVAAPTVEDLIGGLVIGGRAAPPEVVPDLHQGALGHLGTCLNPIIFGGRRDPARYAPSG
jgi:hypothetical protein